MVNFVNLTTQKKGILLGFYLSFRTTEYIIPDLDPNLTKSTNCTDAKSDHYLDNVITYKAYADLVNILSNNPNSVPLIKLLKTESREELERYGDNFESNSNITRVRKFSTSPLALRNVQQTTVNGGSEVGKHKTNLSPKSRYRAKFSVSLDDLDTELRDDPVDSRSLLLDDYNYESRRNYIIEEDDVELDSLDDNESQSNSKFESYLNELIDLFVRDYVLSWLSKFIWEKDKFNILAK